jgi:hypothetical protein
MSSSALVTNQATVVFDANPPITTPTWLNTIDKTSPTSQVLPLPATEGSASFQVKWAGTDVGSGIGSFNIYVSQVGGTFTLWLAGTSAMSATFSGQVGSTYAFYSMAGDHVGNVENAKSVADATTRVVRATATPTGTPTATATVTPLPTTTPTATATHTPLPTKHANCDGDIDGDEYFDAGGDRHAEQHVWWSCGYDAAIVCADQPAHGQRPAHADGDGAVTGSGLGRVVVTTAVNMTVTVPALVQGTTTPIQVTGTRQDQTKSATLQIRVFDVAGNSSTYDPLLVDRQIGSDGAPASQTYPGIPGTEHYLVMVNDAPGLDSVTVTVDSTPMTLGGLQYNDQQTIDLAPPMAADQTSTLKLEAEGRPGASGVLLVGDMPLAGGPAPISVLAPGVANAPSVDLASEVVTALPAGVGMDVSYEPIPVLYSDTQLGDPSLGLVRAVGKPIRLQVKVEDTASGADITLDDSVADQLVPLRLPVIRPAIQVDGEFTWLAEVRQNGQFVGYRRLDTTYDGSTNTLLARSMAASPKTTRMWR